MTTFGAIRWDIGAYGTAPDSDEGENNTLRNPVYHDRAPFFATVENTNSLSIVATQDTMDQEIAFALAGGLNYWAFLRYINLSAGNSDGGLDLFQSSASRGALKWASIEQIGTFGGSSTYSSLIGRLVTEMQQAHYIRVLTDRPLMFLYYETSALSAWFGGSLANLKTALDAIRSAVVAVGIGTPYIVLMAGATSSDKSIMDSLGCDALSSYSTSLPSTLNASYSSLASTASDYWAALAGTGAKVVPICMTGWSPQPRLVRAVPWQASSTRPWVGLGRVVQAATDAEIASHLAAAKAYVQANSSTCEADTFIAYSWNEFGEGYRCLCPTRGNPTGTHLSVIADALA